MWFAETNNLAKLSAKKPVNKGDLGGMGFCKIVNTGYVEQSFGCREKPGKPKTSAALV